MSKPNYAFAKRQREMAKKQKEEEKRRKKAEAMNPQAQDDPQAPEEATEAEGG